MKKIAKLIIMSLSLLLISTGNAVPLDIIWQQTLGGPAEEWCYSLDSTTDGGVVAVGIAHSVDSNISGARGNGDLWVIRMDQAGTPLWNRAYGGNGSDYGLSIRTLPDEGFIIIGTTGSNDGDFSGYHGNGDLLLLRLTSSGDPVWQKVYGGNRTDEGGDIIAAPDGGFVITGYTMSDDGDVTGHHGGGDLWMIRLDSAGSIVWQKTFGGSKRDSGSSIISTDDNGYVMTGNTYSSDGDVSKNQGSSDVWVVKTDNVGNLLWEKNFGGSKLDWGHSVIELPGGDLLVAGVTASSDKDVSVNHGSGDIWVIRLSPLGNLIWEKSYGGSFSDNVWNIDPSPSGGAYLVGETFSVDGDITLNKGDADIFVAEIDGNGNLLYKRTIGGQEYESGSWIKHLPDGNLVVCGTTWSSDGDVSGSRGGGDLWVVKLEGPPALAVVQPPVQNVTTPDSSAPAQSTNSDVDNVVLTSLPMIPGLSLPPTDPDGDGRFEDLNGNGVLDLQDPTVFFTHYDWIEANFPATVCDFNGNGIIDFGDINAFFSEVSA